VEKNKTAVLIVGTGAMGCLFAARFSAVGVPITMMGTWPEGLDALSQNGVCLQEAGGDEVSYPVNVIAKPDGDTKFQYAIVLVKSWQTVLAARRLSYVLAEDGLALTLQNGVGNYEALMEELGPERAVLGVTTAGATLLAPGKVRAGGDGIIYLGSHRSLQPLAELFKTAGFSMESAPDPARLLWGKLVINAAINPLTALLGVANGILLERPPARRLMAEAALEAAAVAASQGIELPFSDPVAAAENTARRTASNLSSMLQDIRRGAPTEIDAICGAIVRAGEETGVPAPVNRTFWYLIDSLRKP
jgi:2-dehydropantoate 2-reductase